MAGETVGCGRVTGIVGDDTPLDVHEPARSDEPSEEIQVSVGQQAPDFTAPTYHQGDFSTVSLSDYLGKWVLLCFYPGDFTFV